MLGACLVVRLQHVTLGTSPRVTCRATMFRQRLLTMTTPSSPEALGLSCLWLWLAASPSPSVCAASVCVGKRMLQTTVVAMAYLSLPQQHAISRTLWMVAPPPSPAHRGCCAQPSATYWALMHRAHNLHKQPKHRFTWLVKHRTDQ